MLLLDRVNLVTGVSSYSVIKTDKDSFCVKTLHLRLKDKHSDWATSLSNQVNFVWNFCNEHSYKVLQREGRFCSAYDIHPYLNGAGKEGLDLHSQTIQAVADEYVVRRKQFKKAKLRWRVSKGSKRSLGWIPFKESSISYKNGRVHYSGKALSLWDSYGLAGYDLGSGSISQDSRGRWYINITVKQKIWTLSQNPGHASDFKLDKNDPTGLRKNEGADLGLKHFLVTSSGQKVESQQIYRKLEDKLAVAQRANNKDQVRSINAKMGNQRKDFLHKLSTDLVSQSCAIFVGNVNSSGLAKTNLAKSVLDSGWSMFRTMLKYKCDSAGVWFKEVNESYSTQECSSCHARTGPKGREELNVRSWTCSCCNTTHDRDINAGINIRTTGEYWMLSQFSATVEGKPIEPVVNKDSGSFRTMTGVGHDPLVVGIPVL